jgi:CBS domain-containing protein
MICPACGHENIEGAELCEHCGNDLTHLSRPKAASPTEKLLHKRPVGALRPHAPVVIPASRKIRDVIASMVIRHDGCAVVVNDAGEVIGVFTERDLLMKLAGKPDALLDSPVSEFMTPDPVTVTADVPIAYALHQMDVGGYRHIPLVAGKKPVGMVSIRDIVTFFGEHP